MRNKLARIHQRIEEAARRSGRNPADIRLVAAAKTVPAETVRKAVEAGVHIIGENYVQEAGKKFNELLDCPAAWHLIGHLQTNKAKYAVRLFDLIHSVDSVKLARELDRQATKAGKVQQILIQINIGDEATKSGLRPEELPGLLRQIGTLPGVSIRGLMTLPPYYNEPEKVRPFFSELRHVRDRMARDFPQLCLRELSMGMSGDFEAAVEEGATLVRIGTSLFGERN